MLAEHNVAYAGHELARFNSALPLRQCQQRCFMHNDCIAISHDHENRCKLFGMVTRVASSPHHTGYLHVQRLLLRWLVSDKRADAAHLRRKLQENELVIGGTLVTPQARYVAVMTARMVSTPVTGYSITCSWWTPASFGAPCINVYTPCDVAWQVYKQERVF